MKKHAWILVLTLLIGLPLGLAIAAGEKKAPATLDIDSNGKSKAVKGFKHEAHTKTTKACTDCHHKVDGKDVGQQKCVTCHTDVKKKDAKTGAPGFKDAFHKACQECHKKAKDKPDLKKCKTCHGA